MGVETGSTGCGKLFRAALTGEGNQQGGRGLAAADLPGKLAAVDVGQGQIEQYRIRRLVCDGSERGPAIVRKAGSETGHLEDQGHRIGHVVTVVDHQDQGCLHRRFTSAYRTAR